MKYLCYLLVVTLSLALINCHSNQSKDAAVKQDSLALQSQKSLYPTSNNKYTITPPNPDYTGDHTEKYPNGIIKFSGFFRFGERHGQWMAFYENGNLWSECFYDKGKKHGASVVYYNNGKPQYKGSYKNDLRDSLWFFYDTLGKQVDKRAFKNDQETGLVN